MDRGGSTADFFSFIDKQNNAIAAAAREGKRHDAPQTGVGVDQHQTQRMATLRAKAQAKGGRLAAKPRERNRPKRAQIVRGYMENPGA